MVGGILLPAPRRALGRKEVKGSPQPVQPNLTVRMGQELPFPCRTPQPGRCKEIPPTEG